jgi:hypothetical protein
MFPMERLSGGDIKASVNGSVWERGDLVSTSCSPPATRGNVMPMGFFPSPRTI